MKVVHQNLLLPLSSDPLDHTNTSDTESVVDQTVNMHGVIAASAVTSHVQDMGAYSKKGWQMCCNKGCYHSLFSRLSLLLQITP